MSPAVMAQEDGDGDAADLDNGEPTLNAVARIGECGEFESAKWAKSPLFAVFGFVLRTRMRRREQT